MAYPDGVTDFTITSRHATPGVPWHAALVCGANALTSLADSPGTNNDATGDRRPTYDS